MVELVRAKFQVTKITALANTRATEVHLIPNYDDKIPEDQRYSKYTPSGSVVMYIDNPPAQEFFVLGQTYYIDFTKVPG